MEALALGAFDFLKYLVSQSTRYLDFGVMVPP